METVYSFEEKLAFSRGVREGADIDTIRSMLPGCVNIVKTSEQEDRTGVDYKATLRGGAKVLIDGKARESGASKYWDWGPEVALEKWSVIPTGSQRGKTGWTLSESSPVDLILFTFDPVDSRDCFLVSFQLLRATFIANIGEWYGMYDHAIQNSGAWRSECIFVPADIMLDAIKSVSKATI